MFVALDIPAPTRRALAAWRDALIESHRDLRPVPPDHLHVTLVFLGWQDQSEAGRIAATAFEAAAGCPPARLAAGDVRPLPARDPRLFALELVDLDGSVSAVQANVSRALAMARFYKPERRPFWAHLTLARVKRGQRRVAPLPASDPPVASFEAHELTLYQSTLRPQGALYEPLAGAALAG